MGQPDPRHAARRPEPPRQAARRRPSSETLLQRRLRAARDLGIPAPALTPGPSGSPRGALAALDRRIARELDLAGGKRLPPWDDDDDGDDPDPWTPSFRRS